MVDKGLVKLDNYGAMFSNKLYLQQMFTEYNNPESYFDRMHFRKSVIRNVREEDLNYWRHPNMVFIKNKVFLSKLMEVVLLKE